MKKLGVVLLRGFISIIVLFSCTTHVTKINKPIKVLSEQNIRGQVKSIIETDFEAIKKLEEIQKGKLLSKKISFFNSKGNQLTENFYNAADSLVFNSICKYNSQGKLIERNSFTDAKLSSKSTLKYDSKGNLIEENAYDSTGSSECKSIYKYDSKCKLMKEEFFDQNRHLIYKSTYKYNKNGDLTEKNIYDQEGGLSSKYAAIYDVKGNKIEENTYSPDGSLINKFTRSYDESGKLIVGNVYDLEGQLSSKYAYKYDSNGNQIEESVYKSDSSLFIKYTYGYDSTGNQIEVNRYDNPGGSLYLRTTIKQDANGKQFVFDYYNKGELRTKYINIYDNYDTEGNWLRRIKKRKTVTSRFKSQTPVSYTEREIKYY